MTKLELIDLLKNYKENKAKLKLKKRQKDVLLKKLINLRHVRADSLSAPTYGINQDIHSKNKVSNRVLSIVEKNDSQINETEQELSKIEDIIRDLENKVSEVEDRLDCLKLKEGELTYAHYIEGRTYEDIGNNVYLELFNQTRDKDTIKRIVDKAIDKMVKL